MAPDDPITIIVVVMIVDVILIWFLVMKKHGAKICPSCGKTVKPRATTCRFCGHLFTG
jgi:predicted RNA-binding Zn-ribbon protein involved in translation (DUF1610 family)